MGNKQNIRRRKRKSIWAQVRRRTQELRRNKMLMEGIAPKSEQVSHLKGSGSESTVSLDIVEFEPLDVNDNVSDLQEDGSESTVSLNNQEFEPLDIDGFPSSCTVTKREEKVDDIDSNGSSLQEAVEHHVKDDNVKWSGRRIVDIDHFFSQIENEWHGEGLNCTFRDMTRVREIRDHYSSFEYKCKMCNKVSFISTEDKTNDRVVPINQAVVKGLIASGNGYSQWSHISAALNIPCMSEKTYLTQVEKLRQTVHRSAWKYMKQAGRVERGLAIKSEQEVEVDESAQKSMEQAIKTEEEVEIDESAWKSMELAIIAEGEVEVDESAWTSMGQAIKTKVEADESAWKSMDQGFKEEVEVDESAWTSMEQAGREK